MNDDKLKEESYNTNEGIIIVSNLKKLIDSREITMYKLSQEIDVRRNTIIDLANNKLKRIPIELLSKLCDYFDCNVEDILQAVRISELSKEEAIRLLKLQYEE